MENLKIGERIKKIRTDRGITKYNFAKSIGISDSSLANYENELRVPSADIIAKICEVYGTSADYLLFGASTDNKSINERTGLSDRAINELSIYLKKKNIDIDILSNIEQINKNGYLDEETQEKVNRRRNAEITLDIINLLIENNYKNDLFYSIYNYLHWCPKELDHAFENQPDIVRYFGSSENFVAVQRDANLRKIIAILSNIKLKTEYL